MVSQTTRQDQKLFRLTGINLKSMPLGESDRILTILTREEGLLRAVARGSRKHLSKLGGRVDLFVVNDYLFSRGRWSSTESKSSVLHHISQAETVKSFPHLSRGLAKLTAAQYLAEVTLLQGLGDHPQAELFLLLIEHLDRLECASGDQEALPLLTHGLYHLLALAGIAPQVHACHYCRNMIQQVHDIHFGLAVGGVVCEACAVAYRPQKISLISLSTLQVLQLLPQPLLPFNSTDPWIRVGIWLTVERLLRKMLEYHFEREIHSTALLDSCWPLEPLK